MTIDCILIAKADALKAARLAKQAAVKAAETLTNAIFGPLAPPPNRKRRI